MPLAAPQPEPACRTASGRPSGPQSAERRELRILSGRHPAHLVERAATKLRWLRDYRERCRQTDKRTAAAETVERVRRAEGDDCRISVRSLQAWDTAYKRDGIDGLVDRYFPNDRDGRPGRPRSARSLEAVEFFYTLYHVSNGPTVQTCHEVTLRKAAQMGWTWAPSVRATEKWLSSRDDLALTRLLRGGSAAYQHSAMGYLEQDYERLSPGEMYVCDHHQLKAFTQYRGKAIRPWLTAVLDARTRVLVGWHFGPAPHSDAILASLRMAFVAWGVPSIVKVDNGRDYTAKMFSGLTKQQLRRLKRQFGGGWKEHVRLERDRVACTEPWFGLLPELGCEIRYALPYQPWSKVVERFFGTLTSKHVRNLVGFCDTSAERKPEGLREIVDDVARLPTLDQTREGIAQWLDIYHATPSLADGLQGRSPRECWSSIPAVSRTAVAGELDLLMNVVGAVTVAPNGVAVTVAGSRLAFGQYSTKLRRWFGRRVLVAIDRNDLSHAVVLTPDRERRRVIARVPRNERLSPAADATSDEMRQAQALINRDRRVLRQAKASAPRRRRTASELIAADRAERARALRATGTHGKPAAHPDQTIRVVPTGFEGVSAGASSVEVWQPPPFDPGALLDDNHGETRDNDPEFDPSALVDDIEARADEAPDIEDFLS